MTEAKIHGRSPFADAVGHSSDGVVVAELLLRLHNAWLVLNVGGGPADDKSDVTLSLWKEKGAQFVTPPADRGPEVPADERPRETPHMESTALESTAHDKEFTTAVDHDALERTAVALRERGLEAQIVADAGAARRAVAVLIPAGAAVLTPPSQTLQEVGLLEEINESGRFASVRNELMKLDFNTQRDEMRRLGGVPDVVVGSVQAITEDGIVVCASASGSQLGPYAYGAGRVIWVVGAQKIVPDLPAAFRRIREHCYPLEDARARRVYGRPSSISKALVVEGERLPGRTTVVLIPESLGV